MADLKVISYNVRGLCSPCKRSKLWWELKKLKAQIVFLQETHFTHQSRPKLPTHLYNQWYISTSPVSKSRGTAIAVHKNCPFQHVNDMVDPQGRYVFLKGTIAGAKYTFATIYAPNSNQLTFIDAALERLAEFREGALIMGGDFNVSPDPSLDTSHRKPTHSHAFLKHFRKSLQTAGLVDSWRVLHPTDRDYSYFSMVHKVYTRIDLLFVDRPTLELLQGSSIESITISDHAPITVTLALPSGTHRAWAWRLNENLLDDLVVESRVAEALTNYFRENTTEGLSEGMIWECHKAVIRGELIAQGTRLKRKRQADYDRVFSALQRAELKHKVGGDPEVLRELIELRELFSRLLERQTRRQLRYLSHKYYDHGNKCGRMLARALRAKRAQTQIHKLSSPSGTMLSQSSKIASRFRDYYANLYNLDAKMTPDAKADRLTNIREYLSDNGLPALTTDQQIELESPITTAEIESTITSLPNGKSPGPDGFTKAYYKKFTPTLVQPMCRYFNSLTQGGNIPPEALLAHISVIPKEGKDPTVPQSYRPISLLNTDVKVLAKILANRLKHLIPHVVHPDQTGFIAGREARDNSIRAIQLIHWARNRDEPLPYLILSTDAEKAFDRIDWSYLWEVLSTLGLGHNMLAWILALYTEPSAQVKVNGTFSPRFAIRNGTRQGCPLSPLLFALALEPLLRRVRASTDIRGLKVGNVEHKLSAYADDVLFHLTNPLISLPVLMQELQHFGTLSNFKINYTKSEILPISLPPALIESLKSAFPFTWAKTSLRYLGIQLTDRYDLLYTTNFPRLITAVRQDLQHWTKTAFTWLGRANIIKMNVLPRILFYMQMLPISLPRNFFAQLSSMLNNFLWNSRKPRIALRVLKRPKHSGGLGVPDLLKYHQAVTLQRILNWRFHDKSKLWVSVEKCLAGRNLSYAPWLAREHRGLSVDTSPLTSATLRTWDRLNRVLHLAPPVSPLAPLGGFLWFPPGDQADFFGTWVDDRNASCGKLLRDGKMIPYESLTARTGKPQMNFWRYRQLHNFFETHCSSIRDITSLTPFEKLFIAEDPIPRMVSELYLLLGAAASASKPAFIHAWERDLGQIFTEPQLTCLYQLTLSSSADTKMQETNYKLLSRWYRVPADLARMYPTSSELCWRGCGGRGTLLHVWWECPLITPFWQVIREQIKEILGIDVPLSPVHFLLHIPPMPISRYKKSALPHLLNAAKRLLPIYWKKTQVPGREDWIRRVNEIREAEEWIATCKDTKEKHIATWALWTEHFSDHSQVTSSLDVSLLKLADPTFGRRIDLADS